MNRFVLRRIILTTLVCLALSPLVLADSAVGEPEVAVGAKSCTAFAITDGQMFLGGVIEDLLAFPARAWFLPPEQGKLGRFYIGFEGVPESGMNDAGLFFDSLTAPLIEVAPVEGNPHYKGMWILRAMEVCRSVNEVVEFLETIDVPGPWTDQLFFGDRYGNSIIVEGEVIHRSAGSFQLCTNFLHSETTGEDVESDRYLIADGMLGELLRITHESLLDVFEAVSETYPDGLGATYAVTYDPRNLSATCYFWRDFEHPIVFNLSEELAKGPHMIELVDVAAPNASRNMWVSDKQIELDSKIKERVVQPLDQQAIADAIGHYVIDAEVGPIPFPPVTIEELSITWDGENVRLVPVPEGIFFDLYHAGDDLWFHPNITAKPEMDFALQRNAEGSVIGGIFSPAGLGDIPFIKASDEPVYEPLPMRSLPVADHQESRSRPVLPWLIIGLGLSLLVGVVALLGD